jgi:hypothetical protein
MRSKAFAHRQRLAAVPAAGFMEVLADSNEDVGAVPEYMPLSVITALITAQQDPPASGSFYGIIIPGTSQALTGPGAITITELKTDFTSSGVDDALSLVDGVEGQIKRVLHTSDGGSGVLTPDNFDDGDTITFTDAGEVAELIMTDTGWAVMDLFNVIDGVTLPAVA